MTTLAQQQIEKASILGHTKTGKPVYDNLTAGHEVYSDFNSKEHSEAAAIHYAQLNSSDPNRGIFHNSMAKYHDKAAHKLKLAEIKAMRAAINK